MIIPEKEIKDKSLDYLEGCASGIRLAVRLIEESYKEKRNFLEDLDDAWDEVLAEQDRQMDLMEADLSKDSDKREQGT